MIESFHSRGDSTGNPSMNTVYSAVQNENSEPIALRQLEFD